MKFGLDVTGGDFAPKCNMDGAVAALNEIGAGNRIVLMGPENLIREELSARSVPAESFDICPCTQTIEMEEKPLKALAEKTDSAIVKGLKMLAEKQLDSFVSAGNSGAMMAGAVTIVKCLPGVLRPCSLACVPQEDGGYSLLVDVGITPDAKPEVMLQFGIFGSLYAKHILGKENPRVSLMNVGTEDGKGNLQCQAAFPLLKSCSHINFTGNLEPRDFFKNKADVFVADGFTGNIVLKLVETFYRYTKKKGLEDELLERCNYEYSGGSPVLGVNAPVILGHGISSALAVKNMLIQSKRMCEEGVVEMFRATLNKL